MVYAFLCHTLWKDPCRLLYSYTFAEDEDSECTSDEVRRVMKTNLLDVAGRVQADFKFRCAAHVTTQGERENEEFKLQPHELNGFFRLSQGDPFDKTKIVIWQVLHKCAFVLILDQDENRLLSEQVLTVIGNLIKDYIIKDLTPSEILLKADKMAAIILKFIPNGQMLFLNQKVTKQYEKELEQLLSGK